MSVAGAQHGDHRMHVVEGIEAAVGIESRLGRDQATGDVVAVVVVAGRTDTDGVAEAMQTECSERVRCAVVLGFGLGGQPREGSAGLV